MPEGPSTIRVLTDAEAVARAGAEAIAQEIARGARTIALVGGTTPRRCYELLAGMDVPWGRVTVVFGDDRCVPPLDPESNYLMARTTLLERACPATVHRIPGELGPAEAAQRYDAVVSALEPIDLVLLGIGPDGHTASLFPGHPALDAPGSAVAVRGAPKPPPDRVSLTLGALRRARKAAFLGTGADKAEAMALAQAGKVPAGMVPGALWLIDEEAARLLAGTPSYPVDS